MGEILKRLWSRSQGDVSEPATGPEGEAARVGPLLPCLEDGTPRRTVGLVALELAEDQIGEVVATLTRLESELVLVPLILTDMDNFELFASRGYVFEHFPSPRSQQLAPAGLPWEAYLQRRLTLLQRKWQPVALIPFGEKAGRALRTWRAPGGGSGWHGSNAGA